jgi:predicted aconitase
VSVIDNLGEAGLDFLKEMAAGGGRVRVLTTLNPAGMDIENWQALGIDADFAAQPAARALGLMPAWAW